MKMNLNEAASAKSQRRCIHTSQYIISWDSALRWVKVFMISKETAFRSLSVAVRRAVEWPQAIRG